METVETFAREHGIPLPASLAPHILAAPVRWNARLRARAGQAVIAPDHARRIELNPRIRADAAALRNTFLHELAHLMTPGAGHGPLWKMTARAIGCSGARCHSIPAIAAALPIESVCEKCGVIGTRARMPRTVTRRRGMLGVIVGFKHRTCGGAVTHRRR